MIVLLNIFVETMKKNFRIQSSKEQNLFEIEFISTKSLAFYQLNWTEQKKKKPTEQKYIY